MEENTVIEQTSHFVFTLLRDQLSGDHLFHNYQHTFNVVQTAKMLGEASGLNEEEMEILTLSAWFHDAGYTVSRHQHEENSAQIASEFLKKIDYPSEKIAQVSNCILGTQMPQSPKTLLQELLCDSDLHHLGKPDFQKHSELLRLELELLENRSISDEEWQKGNWDFLNKHRYFTRVAQEHFQEQKALNILDLKKKLQKIEANELDAQNKEHQIIRPDRGVETLFRVTSKNHIELSAIADTKANIMLSINAIVISISVSGMVPKFDSNSFLILPTSILLGVCLLTIIFATLATTPKVTHNLVTIEDIRKKRANLLFFGNFFQMNLPDFEEGFEEMRKDKEFLYGSLARDIYYLGLVLAKKYYFLRIAYTIFMIGFVIAIISFGASFYYWKPTV